MGLAFSNLGVIPASAPSVYGTVNKFLLPLAVPMLLLAADMRKVITHTGQLLAAFVVGAVGTTLGTLVAFKLVPLTSLGSDGWKVGIACSRLLQALALGCLGCTLSAILAGSSPA